MNHAKNWNVWIGLKGVCKQRALVDALLRKRPPVNVKDRLASFIDCKALPGPATSEQREMLRLKLISQSSKHVIVVVSGDCDSADIGGC
jgi:hypothetical protein